MMNPRTPRAGKVTATTDRKRFALPQLPAQLRSVRARIVAWVIALTAMGLAGAGAAAYVVEGARIDQRIDEAILQETKEFEELQASGIDPRTGKAFTSVDRLLQVALRRNVPDEQQAIIGFRDGRPAYVHPDASRGLENDDAFIDAVSSTPASGFGTLETSEGEVRYASKTVMQGGARRGAYVVAYFVAQEEAEFLDVMRTYAGVASLALIVVGVGAWSVAGRLLHPVRDLRVTAREISETDLTRRIRVEGNDDLSDLARTFNAMLDRLEEAFATQRRFLDDAGHELRTPITIVRGHLELLDERNTEEVEATRALVLDELDRMSRLVEDLVVLAKAERPDFLRPQPMDLGVLTDDVLDKSRGLGDRVWQLDARASGTVLADAQRLTQALLALATNAVQHTKLGEAVGLGSAVEGERVRLWVRDTGTGVPPEHSGRIFERFQRGPDPGAEGSGLGLAIVRAIAEAHGGHVKLATKPGRGAKFSIVIPLRRVDAYDQPPDEDPAAASHPVGSGSHGRPQPSGQPVR